MITDNHMELRFLSIPENEAFSRVVISGFLMQKNPVLSVMTEVRTAISEAVTNAIVHGYRGGEGIVVLRAKMYDNTLLVEVEDYGRGIEDVQMAMQPFFTTQPEKERTGIGFALMQSFMDSVSVSSSPGCGTLVKMAKKLDQAV